MEVKFRRNTFNNAFKPVVSPSFLTHAPSPFFTIRWNVDAASFPALLGSTLCSVSKYFFVVFLFCAEPLKMYQT